MKARKLAVGDTLTLKGRTWEVAARKRDKAAGQVHLTLTAGADRFAAWVPEDRRFERPAPEPLIDQRGAQTRWATPMEARQVERRMTADVPSYDDGETPELDPWVPTSDAEKAVAAIMGGSLVGAQRMEDGLWFVPPIDGSTVMAHLLTFHATEPPSASLADVRTPLAEQLDTAGEALIRADIIGALTLHQQLHAAKTWPDGTTPHRHA